MLYDILAELTTFAIEIIRMGGYGGIFFLMLLGNANIPIPSEVVMPFAGALVFEGTFTFWIVILMGTLGNLAGSLIGYALGYVIGRPVAETWGRYVLITSESLERGESWLTRHHAPIIILMSLIPMVRAFIATPAGILKIPLARFSLYTFIGCFLWSWVLTYAGMILGEEWYTLETYMRKADWIIGIIIVVGIVAIIWRHKSSSNSLPSLQN